jgi:hypothetical protein
MSLDRILLLVATGALLSGCHLFGKLTPDCHTPQEYQHALSAPPNTTGALVIPTVTDAPPPPGPHDTCYDIPPRYKAAPPNKAAGA